MLLCCRQGRGFLFSIVGLIMLLQSPSLIYAQDQRFLNLVAFQAKQANVVYESIFTGELGELITSVENQGAKVVFATHTTALQARDIINLQVDVMRMTKANTLANSGLNCRFMFGDESDEDSYFYSVSGICDRLLANETGTEREKIMVKRKMLSDPSTVFNVWMKFYEDTKTGVAFYVDID